MISENKTISPKKRIYAGIIGGLIGGLTMEIPMVILAMMMGMPIDSFPFLLGLLFGSKPESASVVGMVTHLLVGMAIGAIFGIIVGSSKKLAINGFKKGVGLGIIPGMIVMVIIGLPILFVFIPPVMTKMMFMMNPQITEQIVMQQMQGVQMLMLIGTFVGHIIYGVTLGTIFIGVVKKGEKIEERVQ
ncbi:MAG: hypothetical protein EPO63_06195 [Candidatus Nitrosotenuis sp.]|nr:MAG: hypothetical protein EPO63_06195 [Candidatus Nitrosotenuis sp.]